MELNGKLNIIASRFMGVWAVSAAVLVSLLTVPGFTAPDPVPYAPIAMTMKDSGVDQKVRDNATLKFGRVRVNQAGYRRIDDSLGMAKFYYVSRAIPATTFSVYDTTAKALAGSGTLTDKGFKSGSKMEIWASNWAGLTSGGDVRYKLTSDLLGTTIAASETYEGVLPTNLVDGHYYRVIVGTDTSVAFLISNNIYGHVRDALLKFFGINRSGDGPSWFHAPSHLKDGSLAKPSTPGAYKGGWYDCGDHLKEPQTMAYALTTLTTLTATLPERDRDHYGLNHAKTIQTDGIPDVLAEAHFGAQFFLNAWLLNGKKTGPGLATTDSGKKVGMITGVGDFGKDHGWWGRPENQDAMTETGRGGPKERILRSELGANTLGDVAAALAILSKRYRIYDPKFADSALAAAKDMYAYAKNLVVTKNPNIVVSSPAYNGAGPDKVNGNLALAASALLWVTKDKSYLNDIAYDKTIGSKGQTFTPKASWDGGWMVMSNPNLRKGGANTDWANRHAIALYTFYKLILSNKDSALAYGVRDEAERQNLITHTIAGVMDNLDGIGGASGVVIPLPSVDPNVGGGQAIRASAAWWVMYTQQVWVWNRYQMGNAAELFFYYDMTKDFEAGLAGPDLSSKTWNRDQVRQLMVRQMDYQLGENPWDLSMIFGIGKKNWNHPHHRAANPEGRNTPGTAYAYHSPVGAVYGSWNPETDNDANPNGMPDYNDYTHAEVCLDGSATTLIPAMGLAADEPLNIPPHATVKVLDALDTVADIEVDLDKYGKVTLDYGTVRGTYTTTLKSDSAGVVFKFHLSGLTIGTQYFFDVKTVDLFGNDTLQDHWVNPAPDGTPYGFTTMNHIQGQAKITGVKVCNVTADSAEIMWYTPNGEYQSSICWGKVPPVGSVTSANTTCAMDIDASGHATKFHYVKIGNLQEKTTYYFKVASDGRDGAWDDNKGADYQFTTPVKMANFSVYAVQYTWSSMPALAINVINNEPRNYDSLSLRVYVRAKDTVYNADGSVATHIKSTTTGLVNVPMLFKDVFAARYDICQAYDGAGFNLACGNPVGSWGLVPGAANPTTATWATLNQGVQMLPPVKMADTYDPTTNTNVFYFDLPLGPTMMIQGSRIRFDVIFAKRSGYSKTLTKDQLTLINWVKAFVPSVPQYAVGDTGWYDVLDTAFAQHPLGATTNDWSWMPHSTANGDPVDFIGIPKVADQTAANAIIDNPSDNLPLDPYFTVYRKGQFVYGFSPSAIEQSQKKTYWGIRTALDTPFNVPGTAITLDQATSKVVVTGTADIYDILTPAAKGIVTDIWVNGVRLTPAELATAAVKDPATGLWNLKIPVKLAVGGQSLDITIFGGGSQCPDTATTCSGGCAFYDANYFVQFTKGPSTKSVMTLLAPDGSTYPVKTAPDSLALAIRIADKDQSKKGALGATVQVTVSNPLRAFAKAFTLTETADTGVFRFGGLSLTAKTAGLLPTEIPFLRGDTIWFTYHDINDVDDSSIAFVYSEATWPLPVKAGLFRACDGSLKIRATFDKAFTAAVPWNDAEVVALNAAGDSVGVVTVPAAQITKATGAEITMSLTEAAFGAWQKAKLTLPVADGRGSWVSTPVSVSDSIGPWVDSAKVVENVLGTAQDTAYVWISEKVTGIGVGSFVISRAGITAPVAGIDSVRATDATGRAWIVFLKAGNLLAGDSLRLLSTSAVRDMVGNAPSDCPSMGRKVSLVGRAAPFSKAWIVDSDGDGFADQVKMIYRKIVKASDLPDSIEVTFGDFATVRTAPVLASQAIDSTVTVALPIPFGWGQTKGIAADGSGTISLWKSGSRSSASALADSVGPVLVGAALRFARLGDQDTLALLFSEPVGPSTGTSWLTQQAGADLGVASPVSVANTWYYPIPAGSVVAGDSVKPLTTSRWVDLVSGHHAPAGHPWIAVVGGERAPFYGWYTDENGDGAVDHVHIRFQKAAPKTRPSFSISLAGVSKIVIDTGLWTMVPASLDAVVEIGPLAKNVTGFGPSATGVWKSMGIETDFPIYDSVAPVLVSANLRYASGDSIPDTLKVRWSEPLQGVGSISPVVHGSSVDRKSIAGFSTLDVDRLGATILVWADSMGFARGDSAQLDGVALGIRDESGNVPGPNYGWAPIKFGNRPIRLAFTIKNMLVTPTVPPVRVGPSLTVQVRARPDKGGPDVPWQRLDGFAPLDSSEIVSLTFTINRAMAGSAHIFDNSGAFVIAIDLGQIQQMDAAGTLPKDASGMFQVQLAWDGRDLKEKPVASGVYFMRLVLKDGGLDSGEPTRIVNKVYSFGIKRTK